MANVILQRFLGLKLFSCEAVNIYFQTAACSEDSLQWFRGEVVMSAAVPAAALGYATQPHYVYIPLLMLQLEGNQVALEGASRTLTGAAHARQ